MRLPATPFFRVRPRNLRTGSRGAIARVVLVALLGVSVLPVASPPAAHAVGSQRSVTVSLAETPASGNAASLRTTVSGFAETSDLIATVRVDQGDVLVDPVGTVSFAAGYEAEGPERTFSGSYGDMVRVLEQHVRWGAPNAAVTGSAEVTVTEAPAGDDFFFFPGHPDDIRFYQFIGGEAQKKTWSAARDDAAGRNLLDQFTGVDTTGDVPGYLATITSAAENDFIAENTTAQDIWIGASDAVADVNLALGSDVYANQAAVEGAWHWVTGPEAGTHFCTGNDPCVAEPGPEGEPHFTSWAAGEPNNSSPGEHVAVTNWGGSSGAWNDLSAATRQESYLVEYGGMGDTGLIPQARGTAGLASVNAVVITAEDATIDAVRSGTQADITLDVAFTAAITDGLTGGASSTEPVLVTFKLPEGGGTLRFAPDGPDAFTLAEGYTFNGHQVGFTGTYADVADALDANGQGALSWTPPGEVGDLQLAVSISLLPDTANEVFFDPDTGHYYEYVPDAGITFSAARSAAEATTLFGNMRGFLTTPVTAGQNDFIAKHTTARNVWIGASDHHLHTPQGHSTAEGRWYWVSGPEAGTEFWRGAASGRTLSGGFASWASGEPNNYGSGEHFAVTNWRGSLGLWNDLQNQAGTQISGYVVEYRGSYLTDGGPAGTLDGRDHAILTVLPVLADPPDNITAVASVVDGDHRLTVSWDPAEQPADAGEITGYEVAIDPSRGTRQCDETSCTFSGLPAATGFVATVRTVNGRGAGDPGTSAEAFTAAGSSDGVGDAGSVSADPGADFVGVAINATMPADRTGRINIPRGRLSRSSNDTDVTAVDVKLPYGLGGCLEIDAKVDSRYGDVEVTLYDSGFHAWVVGPEGAVGQALDDGIVYWNPSCDPSPADRGPAALDEDGRNPEHPWDAGVAVDDGAGGSMTATAALVGGDSLGDVAGDGLGEQLGLEETSDAPMVAVVSTAESNDTLSFDEAGYLGAATVGTAADGSLLIAGTESEVRALLDGGLITVSDGDADGVTVHVRAGASGDDRFSPDVTAGRAEARISLPEGGGTIVVVDGGAGSPDTTQCPATDAVCAAEAAWTAFADAGGSVRLDPDTDELVISGPVAHTGEHGAFEAFLAHGVLWAPEGNQGVFALEIALTGDGGYAATATASLRAGGLPAMPTGVTATWVDDMLRVAWTASDPVGEPAATYTVSDGTGTHCVGTTELSCELPGLSGAGATITVAADNGLPGSPVVSEVLTVSAQRTLGAAEAEAFTVVGDHDTVTVRWDAAAIAGDEVTVKLLPADGDGSCSASATDGTCTIYGLTPGTSYGLDVVVTGTDGDSQPLSLDPITPLTVTFGDGGAGDEGTITTPQASSEAGLVPLPIHLDLTGWDDPTTATVSLDAAAGTLDVADATTHPGVEVSGAGTSQVVLSGPAAAVEAALADLTWTPADAPGTHNLKVQLTDDARHSELDHSVRIYAALSAPRTVTANRSGSDVEVDWTEPEHGGQQGVSHYVVTVGSQTCEVVTVPLTCTLRGISSTQQEVTVTAHAGGETAKTSVILPGTGGGTTPGPGSDGGDGGEPPTAPSEPVVRRTLGDGGAIVDGEAVDTRVSAAGGTVTLDADDFLVRITPADRDGAPTGALDGVAMQLRTGGTALIDVEGFQPASQVTAWLFADAAFLGTFTVAADGTLEQATGRIPAMTPACAHTLVLEGTAATGQHVRLELGVWVEAHPYPFTDTAHNRTHGPQIGCAASLGIATGYGGGLYGPTNPVTRGQMASFLARTLHLDVSGTSDFPDVAGTHGGAVTAIVAAGIADGYQDGTFRPRLEITRQQMATMLANAAQLEVGEHVGSYSDLTGGVHDDAVRAVSAAGIAHGHDDGTFRPMESVSRQQMASFLVRLRDHLESDAT